MIPHEQTPDSIKAQAQAPTLRFDTNILTDLIPGFNPSKYPAGRAFFPTSFFPCTSRFRGRHSRRLACLQWPVYVRTYCVHIASLNQNKRSRFILAQIKSNGDLFTCKDDMLFSNKTCFRAKAHLVLHLCLHKKYLVSCRTANLAVDGQVLLNSNSKNIHFLYTNRLSYALLLRFGTAEAAAFVLTMNRDL